METQITTYFHLLALRAVTCAQTSQWSIPTHPSLPCNLAHFTLQLATPQSNHNQHACKIFTSHFVKSAAAKLYSIKCITSQIFNEQNIGHAFDHALRVQIQLQQMSTVDNINQAIYQQECQDARKLVVIRKTSQGSQKSLVFSRHF